MELKELNDLVCLEKEIKAINDEIEELSELRPTNMLKMINTSNVNDPVERFNNKKSKLEEDLLKTMNEYIEKYNKIIKLIDSIDNAEIRLIIRLKYIKGLTWYDVAETIADSDKYLDRTAPRKKLKRYLERMKEK